MLTSAPRSFLSWASLALAGVLACAGDDDGNANTGGSGFGSSITGASVGLRRERLHER